MTQDKGIIYMTPFRHFSSRSCDVSAGASAPVEISAWADTGAPYQQLHLEFLGCSFLHLSESGPQDLMEFISGIDNGDSFLTIVLGERGDDQKAFAFTVAANIAFPFIERLDKTLVAIPARYTPLRHGHLLCDQSFVGQPLPRDAINETAKPFQRVMHDVALVQPERKFIDVPAKVLRAGVMVDANQAALEDRENGLDAVRGHAVADVFASRVIDRVVVEEQAADPGVGQMLVGVQGRSDRDVLHDDVRDRPGVRGVDLHRLGATALAAFLHAQNGGSCVSAP
jgi:hypothetical protein